MRNVKINKKKGVAEIDLNPDFYTKDTLQKTSDRFKDICKINISDKAGRIKVKVKARNKEVADVTYEFLNHLIADMKNYRNV